MADAVLVFLGTRLAGEELGELLVEVDEVLGVLLALELVLGFGLDLAGNQVYMDYDVPSGGGKGQPIPGGRA